MKARYYDVKPEVWISFLNFIKHVERSQDQSFISFDNLAVHYHLV